MFSSYNNTNGILYGDGERTGRCWAWWRSGPRAACVCSARDYLSFTPDFSYSNFPNCLPCRRRSRQPRRWKGSFSDNARQPAPPVPRPLRPTPHAHPPHAVITPLCLNAFRVIVLLLYSGAGTTRRRRGVGREEWMDGSVETGEGGTFIRDYKNDPFPHSACVRGAGGVMTLLANETLPPLPRRLSTPAILLSFPHAHRTRAPPPPPLVGCRFAIPFPNRSGDRTSAPLTFPVCGFRSLALSSPRGQRAERYSCRIYYRHMLQTNRKTRAESKLS